MCLDCNYCQQRSMATVSGGWWRLWWWRTSSSKLLLYLSLSFVLLYLHSSHSWQEWFLIIGFREEYFSNYSQNPKTLHMIVYMIFLITNSFLKIQLSKWSLFWVILSSLDSSRQGNQFNYNHARFVSHLTNQSIFQNLHIYFFNWIWVHLDLY